MAKDLEKQLFEKLRCGDPTAVAQWFSQYHDRVLAVVTQKIESSQDAEEIVQETFINCLRQIALFRHESSIFTWMCAIARHEVADYYRRQYAKKALKTLPLSEYFFSQHPTTNEVPAMVQTVLVQLSQAKQELLRLKYVDGKSVKQIAESLGKSVKSVEAELFRARNEFRALWSFAQTE